ncbi:MAG: acetyl-CoA carboxylase biotin carboxylase subunit [Actinomycetes bacterium]
MTDTAMDPLAIRKVLIANRGEIAVRIIAACRKQGIASVAVYSDADANSKHVRQADEAVHIGPTVARESYLNIDRILAAARESGADAIHPGYGFLAENADFSAAVSAAGFVFIGPPAAAIEAMGEKVAARERARNAGVPQVPGSTHAVTSAQQVSEFAAEFGYPVAIKAAYGGGGRGMRLVHSDGEVVESLESAQREALAAFGHDDVYLEKYLAHARHVEVQVFADNHGNVVWLGDRDCSIQRRHQKVIEESPAPGLSGEMRRAMGEASVRLAREVGYRGAGTVEFLVQDGAFYFLEMNTRIQVEHPVTEEVIGLDLVSEQLRVAGGLPLSIVESGPPSHGHAIEIRVNAEDCADGRFLPAPGKLATVSVPLGDGVRFDGGYDSGDEVLPYYDSLIGKLIVWAPSRSEAIDSLLAVSKEAVFDGVPTTLPAAQRIIDHADFRSAEVSTRWLEDQVAAGLLGNLEEEPIAGNVVWVGERQYVIPFFGDESQPCIAEERVPQANAYAGQGQTRTRAARAGTGSVVSPMQGTIQKVLVEIDDVVEKGALLFVIEAMKMENPVRAAIAGVVTEVGVSLGDVVTAGAPLALISAP